MIHADVNKRGKDFASLLETLFLIIMVALKAQKNHIISTAKTQRYHFKIGHLPITMRIAKQSPLCLHGNVDTPHLNLFLFDRKTPPVFTLAGFSNVITERSRTEVPIYPMLVALVSA